MTRNERKKAVKARKAEKLTTLINAAISDRNAAIVAKNLSGPRPQRSPLGLGNRAVYDGSTSHRGYVCKAGGSMERRRAVALKARGSY